MGDNNTKKNQKKLNEIIDYFNQSYKNELFAIQKLEEIDREFLLTNPAVYDFLLRIMERPVIKLSNNQKDLAFEMAAKMFKKLAIHRLPLAEAEALEDMMQDLKVPLWVCPPGKINDSFGFWIELGHVSVLYLSNLTKLPCGLEKLDCLKKLIIRDCKNFELSDSLGKLASLRELYISYTSLRYITPKIGDLSSLTKIDFYESYFNAGDFPESIGNLSNLKILSIVKTSIKSIPDNFWTLKSLEKLDLAINNLESISESIGNLTSLTSLCLDRNKLTALPSSICNLPKLQELIVYNNKLLSIPETIGNLKSLQTLHIYNNFLSKLPESIGDLEHLKIIHVGGNNLTELPESFGNLTSLKELGISDNKLITLPTSLINLTNLEKLSFGGNPIQFSENLLQILGTLQQLNTIHCELNFSCPFCGYEMSSLHMCSNCLKHLF